MPREPAKREPFLSQVEGFVGEEATVRVALAGEMPAVELEVWKRGFICGNGLGTWDPDAAPISAWHAHPIAANLAIEYEDALREPDLTHPDADPAATERIRRAHDYGIRHRVGEAP